MKIKIVTVIALCSSIAFAESISPKDEGIKYIKMLGSTLKSELKAKIKDDPTAISAINFCQESASRLTEDVNKKLPKYASVRRTALRLRNEKNRADKIDIEVMNSYSDTNRSIKVVKDGNTTRVYKPLTIKKVCLKCHGSNISPEVSNIIKEKYQNDKAIGYKEGDFRGVIVAEIKRD
ncbi:Cytochrome c family protein [hydrothermal vent metagenome]|uniref:Cytochrome c family protein n=1 Tax=hydrothermal vent metagenome TaxID=652676 RepID=A0A1W1C2Y1_9ZZZZ